MSHRSRAIFLFMTIVSVLLVSAVGTTSVYADDGTPPPPPTEAVEVDPSSPEGEPAVTEPDEVEPPAGEVEPAVTEPVEVEPPAGEGESVVTEPIATEPPVTEPLDEVASTEEAPVVEEQLPAETDTEAASILEQVPDDTTVTVLNAEGEAQPLTSQESADAILVSDPIWCPASVFTPTPGANGCTEAKANFTELLTFLKDNETDFQQAGTIYVEMGAYTGGESSIDFNAYEFQYINNYNLTVHGGWDTVDNSKTDTTELDIPIVIGTSTNPWVGSLAINNISIDGVSNQTGLTLFSQGTVTLFNVQVTNSQAGADLNAGAHVAVQDSKFNNNKKFGAKINAGGIVQIKNSEFSNNRSSQDDGFGLEIDNQNSVSLSSVTANANEKFGADINSTGDVTVMDSFFNGNISYSNCSHSANGGYGLKIVTTSWAYLDEGSEALGVEANGNYLFGAHVETGADGAYIWNSSFNGNGSGSMSNPKGYGLEVLSGGVADLNNVNANNNQLFGANIKAGGEVFILSSFFDGNKSYKYSCNGASYYGYGLQVVTSANVTMSAVSASGNNLFGAHLEGLDIAILDGTFSNNGTGNKTLTGKGLEIVSTGQVALDTIQANNNQLFGADIQAAGNVAISDSFFNGHKYTYSSCQGSVTSGGYGLQVVTNGNIALSVVEATDNYLYGARLEGADVAVSGTSVHNSLFNNNKSGLEIKSSGRVALNRVQANDNKLFGADIASTGDVAIRSSFFNGNQSYTSSSCKGKTYNGYGLKVVTTGAVALLDVSANENYVFGAYLEGTDVAVSALDFTVPSSFSNNGTGDISDHIGKGLEIVSTGSDSVVSLSGVTASNNQLFGANVKADGLVFVDNSVFSGNQSYTYSSCKGKTYDGYGLKVITTSNIKLDTVTANENYLFGAHLEGANVTVKNSFFSLNASPTQQGKTPTGRGLEVKSTGDTLLEGVEASDNQLFGADVQAGGKVEVVSSIFARNKYYTYSSCKGTKSAGYGLKVVTTDPTLGTVALTGVQALENGAEGAILNGQSTVQVVDSSFNSNGASGLSVTASGDVTLTNVTADGNQGNGVDVKGFCTNTVYVNGGTFTNNSKYGIKIVDATYATDGAQTFANNGAGDVFQSGCVTSASTASDSGDSQNSSGSSSDSNYTSGQWYWYWYAHGWHRHHHH